VKREKEMLLKSKCAIKKMIANKDMFCRHLACGG